MFSQRSSPVVIRVAAVIAGLMLTACGPAASTSPTGSAPNSSPSATGGPTATATNPLESAPAFVHKFMTEVALGDSRDPHLAVADLNEDGKPDLVTTSHFAGVVLLLGKGDGTFEAPVNLEVDPGNVVDAADLDGDGHVDLVAAGDRLAVLLGKGDGTFAPPVYYAAGSDVSDPELSLSGLDIADLNADGIPDLVAPNWAASQLSVLLGKGAGTFGPASLYPCAHCFGVAAADLDGNGALDVAAASFAIGLQGAVYAFLNDGGGHLGKPVAYDPGGNAIGIALGDLNGDGALDVVTGNDRSHSISVMLGNGDGTFAAAHTHPAGNTHTVAVVDLDGDGKLDVVSGSFEDTTVAFYRGAGDGTLIETQGIDVTPDVALSLAVADLDGDSKLDLALYYTGSRALVSVLLGN
jgi:hypothetical protein